MSDQTADFLKLSLGGLEVNLGEFVTVVRDLTSVKLDSTTQDALNTLISEARKSFDAVVDILTPFYALNTPAKVRDDFPRLYSNFKAIYFKGAGDIRTHCSIVSDQIEKMTSGQAWKRNVPILQKAFNRLKASQTKWIGNDDALADSMSNFLSTMDSALGEIAKQNQGSGKAALQALAALISDAEPELTRIKQKLNELSIASARLS